MVEAIADLEPEDEKYRGFKTQAVTTAKQDDQGRWHVKYVVIQSRSKDLEEWEDKALEMNASDKNLDKAMADAVTSVVLYLKQVDNDLFIDDNPGAIFRDEKELLN